MGPRGRGSGGGGGGGGGRGPGRGGGRGRGDGGGRGGGPGSGGGRGRRRGGMGFLRPGLLTLLRRDSGHGYNLLQGLEELGIDTDGMDPSVVYRALRDMEQEGLVNSQWGEESLGPRRRVYTLTGDGDDVVSAWVEDLEKTRTEIDRLLSAMKESGRDNNSDDGA
jgi:PadR family transcriptional regulator, regulatory protein PadR